MSEDLAATQDPDLDVDVKKRRGARRRLRTTSVRRTLLATSELLEDLAMAAAEAFEAFADEVAGSNPGDDLITTVSTGFAEGNERYLRRLSGTSRRFVDRMQSSDEPSKEPPVEIDYEHLAKLVAAELEKRKVGSEASASSSARAAADDAGSGRSKGRA
jgi:hypothetical protein